MAFREVRVFEMREVLRLWLRGKGRARSSGWWAWTARPSSATSAGAATPAWSGRRRGRSSTTTSWPRCASTSGPIAPMATGRPGQPRAPRREDAGVARRRGPDRCEGHTLLARKGSSVPERTVQRFCAQLCGPRRAPGHARSESPTASPGSELQVDFGKMGLVPDPAPRPQEGLLGAHLHRLLLPPLLCLVELPPDHRGRHRRL